MNPILVEALRGDALESAHRGAIAVIDAGGAVLAAIGDVQRPIFPRSAIKLMQALPLVESGAADKLGLAPEELAITCASHGGESLHTQVVARMLEKAGLDASALECGIHWPYHEDATRGLAAAGRLPNELHNNCSGKHGGFLCLACVLSGGGNPRQYARGYIAPEHPVMRAVTATIQAITDFDLATAPRGTDGCSIPTFGIPLRNLALGFARMGTGHGLRPGHARAAQRLREAVAMFPQMVAGTGRFDSRVMQRLGPRVFCKVGAEGVYCACLPERGSGIAIKIDDGNNARAAEVVMAAAIEALLPLSDDDAVFMRGLSDVRLKNWNGLPVGQLRATPSLRASLGHAAHRLPPRTEPAAASPAADA